MESKTKKEGIVLVAVFASLVAFMIPISISASIAIFAVLLLVLSVSGYRKTRIRMTIYAIIIFALFAIQQFLDFSDDLFETLDNPIIDLLIHSLTLSILVIFFLAIVRAPTKS